MDGKRKDRYDLIKEKRRKSEGAQAVLQLQNLTEFLQEEPVEATDCVIATGINESTTETSETYVKSCETQTDTSSSDIQALEAEIKSLRDNSKVREQLKEVSLDESGFRDNNEKVLFYTGLLSWNLLCCIYNFVLPYLSQSAKCTLSPFQRLMLTLIRLRLNFSGKDLAYRFGGVHETTVSRIFFNVLDVLYLRLNPLIYWPEREQSITKDPSNGFSQTLHCL